MAYLCIDKIRPIKRNFLKHLKGFLKTCNTKILATYHKSSPYAERMASNLDMCLSSFNNFLRAAYAPIHSFIFSTFDNSSVYFLAYKANTNNQPTGIPSSSALTNNCATGNIWKDLSHFVENLIPDCSNIRGIGKEVSNWKGTVSFQLTNDNGKPHQITLSNVSYLPCSDKNLISFNA